MAASHCRYCGRDIEAGESVRLWDGRDYCEKCVEKTLPGLAEHARTHPKLKEGPPPDVLLPLFTFAMIGPFSLAMFLYLGLSLLVFLIVLSFVVIVVTTYFASRLVAGCGDRPALTAGDGRLIACSWPDHRRKRPRLLAPSTVYKLDAGIWWREAIALSISFAAVMKKEPFRRTIVLIAFRRVKLMGIIPLPPAHIFCGWTPEMRERWKAFLTLAGIPKRGSQAV
ncbi:MAG: hypothetical protein ABIF82_07490 [Planctomycetota bacterium]